MNKKFIKILIRKYEVEQKKEGEGQLNNSKIHNTTHRLCLIRLITPSQNKENKECFGNEA